MIGPFAFARKQANRNKNEQDQKRKPNELKSRDHIYAWRTTIVVLFAHHGDEKVIHLTADSSSSFSSSSYFIPFSSSSIRARKCKKCQEFQKRLKQNSSVTLVCINCFLGGDELYVFLYSLPKDFDTSQLHGGTYSTDDPDPPKEVVDRANYLLHHGFGSYNLRTNNCETFAQYCTTGLVNLDLPASGQIKTVGIKILEAINPIPLAIAVADHPLSMQVL
ncbi:hypothetical protein LUZ60_002404 [Juncus effusus]|nr:hypothetical protein LUZ60_002404 [Juncus effusus]